MKPIIHTANLWRQILPNLPDEICIYLLYVCYNSENKQQRQHILYVEKL